MQTRRMLTQSSFEEERERLAILNRPPAPNPPELVKLTHVRVLRPFCVAGERVEVNAIVTLPRNDADSLAALKKVEFLR